MHHKKPRKLNLHSIVLRHSTLKLSRNIQDNFLDGTSSSYLEELEERFRADPASVDKTWASFFTNLGAISEQLTQSESY